MGTTHPSIDTLSSPLSDSSPPQTDSPILSAHKQGTGEADSTRPSARPKLYAEWLAFVIARTLLRWLPRTASIGLGAAIGRLAWHLRIRRRVVLENLTLAFPEWPDSKRFDVARQSYANFGRMTAEWLGLPALSPEALDRLSDAVEGEPFLKEAGLGGRGFVVVSGHVGNWELMGSYFARNGYRLKVIAKPAHNPRVEAEVAAMRREQGFEILYTGEGLKPGLRHLRGGGVLAILADQDARRNGIAVPFFGVPASSGFQR